MRKEFPLQRHDKKYIVIRTSSNGHECVKLLLQSGADVNNKNNDGTTALLI